MTPQIEALMVAPQPNLLPDDGTVAVQAWNARQTALAAIEREGRFFGAGDRLIDNYSDTESGFAALSAESLSGIAAKLIVALSHMGRYCHTEEDRVEHDAVRRADMAEVATFIDRWDFGEQVLFSAICDLARVVKRCEPAAPLWLGQLGGEAE